VRGLLHRLLGERVEPLVQGADFLRPLHEVREDGDQLGLALRQVARQQPNQRLQLLDRQFTERFLGSELLGLISSPPHRENSFFGPGRPGSGSAGHWASVTPAFTWSGSCPPALI
jgi:hypothetical protein